MAAGKLPKRTAPTPRGFQPLSNFVDPDTTPATKRRADYGSIDSDIELTAKRPLETLHSGSRGNLTAERAEARKFQRARAVSGRRR